MRSDWNQPEMAMNDNPENDQHHKTKKWIILLPLDGSNLQAKNSKRESWIDFSDQKLRKEHLVKEIATIDSIQSLKIMKRKMAATDMMFNHWPEMEQLNHTDLDDRQSNTIQS